MSDEPGEPHLNQRQLLDRRSWPNATAVHRAVFDYTEVWYDTRRLHNSLAYQSHASYDPASAKNLKPLAA